MKSEDMLLVQRLNSGDYSLIKELDGRYKKYAASICRKLGIDSSHSVDIFQNSIAHLLQNIKREGFTLTSQLSTYFYSICHRQALKFLYDESKHIRATEGASERVLASRSGIDIVDTVSMREQTIAIRVQHLLKEVSPACREVLRMYYVEDLSMNEIAEKLGYRNSDTAKVKKLKCMVTLRNLVNKNDKNLLYN